MFISTFIAFLGIVTISHAQCTRAIIKSAADAYVAAQSSGQAADFSTFTNNVNYTENEKQASLTTGILSKPLKIDHSRSILDTTICGTFTEIIVTDPAKPYVVATRMLFTDDKVTTMESIVTTTGDWAFNATSYLSYVAQENWDPIPADKREIRAVIQAAGDAYFNRFNNTSVVVPWGPPCTRIEGGIIVRGTLTGDDCVMVWPSTIVVTNRRYIIDEEAGTVDIFLGFPGLDRSQGQAPMPDSHLFRVEGGKIKFFYIQLPEVPYLVFLVSHDIEDERETRA
ncbi:hypothetical protein B0O99DRAFT_663545 [Bisporella sp. PMI_857]|nr:hypothetical protein B0O99DRAFT_663545 [Bisporella sp. PMI_857]